MKDVNRNAIIIQPAGPMIAWIIKVYEQSGEEPPTAEELTADPSVYLVPEFETVDELEEFFRSQASRIFGEELAGWTLDTSQWPEMRDWATFGEWMNWTFAGMVLDLDEGPLEVEPLPDWSGDEFDINEDLFDEEGYVDEHRGSRWVDKLYILFSRSPEGLRFREAHPREPIGWTTSLFDYIHGYDEGTIHDVDAQTLDFALMSHFPRKVIDPELDAAAVIDELRELFAFLEREYGLENARECLDYLETPGLAERFDAAMNNPSSFGMAKSLFSGRGLGLPPSLLGFPQQPYRETQPDIGRNAPCPCGSGRKYKKCCGANE
jgi:hypothetical protein